MAFDDTVVITFSQRNAGEASAEVELSRFIVGSNTSSMTSTVAQVTLSDTTSTSSTTEAAQDTTAPTVASVGSEQKIGSFSVTNVEVTDTNSIFC